MKIENLYLSFSFFIDLLFPPICLSCDSLGKFICLKCQFKMSKLGGFICPSCLRSCSDGEQHAKCKGNINGLISSWDYKQTTQKIIKEIKYRFYYASIDQLVELFLENRQQSSAFDQFIKSKPLIIPVPLHPKRLNYRGFNQAQLIANKLAKAWDLPMSSQIIIRTKFSKPQAELTKQERLNNTRDIFAVNSQLLKLGNKPLKKKNILLVDDVWTTGSTCQACAGVLKKLGVEEIWVLTMAR